jgi:hypothetical protein
MIVSGSFAMRTMTRAIIPAILIAAAFTAYAHAIKPQIPAGHEPPAEQQQTEQRPAPQAQAKPEAKPACISDHSGFKTVGKTSGYMIVLENACAQRQRCKVSAYVVTSQGAKQANATLTLSPMANGQPARQTHMIKTRDAGGMASLSRTCKVI